MGPQQTAFDFGGDCGIAPEASSGIVYVDDLFYAVSRDPQARRVGQKHGHLWCHMWSDDLEALHRMAAKIGMRRAWFQNRDGLPHYDLVPPRRAAAIRYGAQIGNAREWVRAQTSKRQ